MQLHFCPEGATVIIHDTPKRSATMPNRFFRRSLGGGSKNSRCAHLEILFLDSDS
jgi:hypothetical protein